MKHFPIVLLLCLAAVFGCNKKFDPKKQADLDEAAINQYLADHNQTAIATGTGLHYKIDSLGTGVYPTTADSVTAQYKGYYTDGSVFDQSLSTGATFFLGHVINGWKEGIPFFKEGGGGKLYVPSVLGYGNQDYGSIPANSVLIFDVHLINVL